MWRDCSKFRQFPRSGDWFTQDDFEMESMHIANCSEIVYRKQMSGVEWDLHDAAFVDWVEFDE